MRHYFLFLLVLAGFYPVTTAEAQSNTSFPTEGYDCVTLLDSTDVSVDANGSGTFSIYKKVRILTKQGGLNYRVLKYDYDPLTAFAEFRQATIYRKNGDIYNLDVTQAKDYTAPARMIYWGARQIMVEVGYLEPGDEIEYKIRKRGFTYALLQQEEDNSRFIPPMRGQFYDIVPFWVNEPTVRKVYQLTVPKEKELQYQFYQGTCASSVRFTDTGKQYRFTSTCIYPFKREPNMVDLYDAAPKLMLSSTPDWYEKSKWFYNVNEEYGSFEPLPEAQEKVNEIIKGKKGEMEKIAALTHWVADNIRYAGISMGKGEGYTLHNTKMNFTDRCGVCKDIAGTLISFLRMAGFKAYPAMTMAGSRIETIPADHFNHCVAIVQLSDGTLMPLDPTWVPFCRELWSSAEQQQNYLPGLAEGSDLCITPVSAPENHLFSVTAEHTLSSDGTLEGKVIVAGEGQSDRAIRAIFTTGWQSEWKKNMEQQLLNVSPKAKLKKVDWGKDPKAYQEAPIRIVFEYEIPDYALLGENTMLLKPMVMNNFYNQIKSYLRIDTRQETRNYGFKNACSRQVLLDETIYLPKDYALETPARKDTFEGKAASFEGYVKQTGKQIKLHHELRLNKRVYEAGDWNDFRKAINLHKAYDNYFILKKRDK